MPNPAAPPELISPDWIAAVDPGGGPIYLQIVAALEAALSDGTLKAGDRLPPQRRLAARLGVDLTTITRAYTEARRRGLVDAVTGRGSFLTDGRASAAPVDLSMNIPPSPRGLDLGRLIEQGIGQVLRRASADLVMSYHVGPGASAERAAGAQWLAPVTGPVAPERIVVCAGAQAALAALLSTLARPGEVVLAEPRTYPGFIGAAAQLGVTVEPVAADEDGIMPDALARACRTHAPRFLYLQPNMQNPTTVTMPEARRREIARIAAALHLPIVEDDPYGLLAEATPPSFAALAPALTFHVATVSKCLTPGLRTAFLLLPVGRRADDILAGLRAFTLMPAPLMTALLAGWIQDGTARRVLEAVRTEARARQELARALLPESAAHPNGLHIWLPLPPHWDRHRLMEAARERGLGVTASDAFNVAGPAPDAVRVSLGAVPDRARLAEALRTLAVIVGERRPAHHGVV